MMVRLTTCIIIFAVLLPLIIADDPCRFESSEKGVIDLSSLSHKDGKAAFADVSPPVQHDYIYSYNPCQPFSEGDTCINVAVCQISTDGQHAYILGTQNTTQWDAGGGAGSNPSVKYSYNNEKYVSIELVCSENGSSQLEYLKEDPLNNYQFRLTNKCSCWNGCKGGSGGMSVGAIFIIILVALAVVYLIVFAIYNRFRHQRTGIDLIAHRTFWVALPVYAKDGVTYIFRRVTGKGGLSYQSV